MLRRLLRTNVWRWIEALPSVPNKNCKILARYLRLETTTAPFIICTNLHVIRGFSESTSFPNNAAFEEVCDETLDSLTDIFEELVEGADHLEGTDVNYSDGVLTIQFGEPYGTYVINRQTPNQQIWLSSPTSGPKRYDFTNGAWIYRHDGVSLHQLLSQEISKIVKKPVNFSLSC